MYVVKGGCVCVFVVLVRWLMACRCCCGCRGGGGRCIVWYPTTYGSKAVVHILCCCVLSVHNNQTQTQFLGANFKLKNHCIFILHLPCCKNPNPTNYARSNSPLDCITPLPTYYRFVFFEICEKRKFTAFAPSLVTVRVLVFFVNTQISMTFIEFQSSL